MHQSSAKYRNRADETAQSMNKISTRHKIATSMEVVHLKGKTRTSEEQCLSCSVLHPTDEHVPCRHVGVASLVKGIPMSRSAAVLLEVFIAAERARAVVADKRPLPCVHTHMVVEVRLVVGRVGAVAALEPLAVHGLRVPGRWERHELSHWLA